MRKLPVQDLGERIPLDDPDDNGMVTVERDPPLMVYADYEAITDPTTGLQTPILVAYETEESDVCHLHYGDDCTERFFDDLETLAVDSDGDDRSLMIFFRNLKGYDSMFLLQHCYHSHRTIDTLVTVGAKVLSFTTDRLTFKDSLCFYHFVWLPFPRPLASVNSVKVTFRISSTHAPISPMLAPCPTLTTTIQMVWHPLNAATLWNGTPTY